MKELDFLAGKFFHYDLSPEREFLRHYFRTTSERTFLFYYFCFDGYLENFQDHTGIHCQNRWVNILSRRLKKLVEVRDTAKKSVDLEMLARIERGKIDLKELEIR